jgi:quinol monooxygenase YgiN
MMIVVAQYVVKEGHQDSVVSLLRSNAEASRQEPDCLEFSVYQDVEHPARILLYERYSNEDAFQAHRHTSHFLGLVEGQVVPLLEERVWTRLTEAPSPG